MRLSKHKSGSKDVIIIGDGYTEKIYFDFLKSAEKLRNVKIKPELPSGSGYVGVFKKAEVYLGEGYEKIYCLIDMDAIIAERNEQKYSTEKKRLEKKGVTVLELNPCFEIWFLLHYQQSGGAFNDCDAVGNAIRASTEISDYTKNQDYHLKQNFYKKLRPRLEQHAIQNAKTLEIDRDLHSKNYPRGEVFKLFLALGIVGEK